jgi:hypothetical protein
MSDADNFVLRSTVTSPFGRKVRMAIDVLGLADRVKLQSADPLAENDTLRQQNPLGKMPCLVLADGSTIHDSGIIIEYLQDVAGTDRCCRLAGATTELSHCRGSPTASWMRRSWWFTKTASGPTLRRTHRVGSRTSAGKSRAD